MPARKPWTRTRRLRLLEEHGYRCVLCRGSLSPYEDFEVDHAHALGLGGPDDPDNVRPVHRECHAFKTVRDAKAMAKVKRQAEKHAAHREALKTGTRRPSRRERLRALFRDRDRDLKIMERQE